MPNIKPKESEWIYGENKEGLDGYYCKHCKFHVPWWYDYFSIDFIKAYKFCPKCGYQMTDYTKSN